jgi:sulfide-dependent adenosine diphosphate thiazole synthase
MVPMIVVQEEGRQLPDHFGIRIARIRNGTMLPVQSRLSRNLLRLPTMQGWSHSYDCRGRDGPERYEALRSCRKLDACHYLWPSCGPVHPRCRYAIDATGHDAVVASLLQKKTDRVILKGEGFMWADKAESRIIRHTK